MALLIIVGGIVFFFSQSFLLVNSSSLLKDIRLNFKNTYISIVDGQNLKSENLVLKKQITEYQAQLLEMETLRKDLEVFSTQNNIIFSEDQELLYANVLDNSELFIYGKKVINVGKKVAVKEGDLVIAHGVLVGEVSKAYKYTSEIRLLSHNESIYSVILEDNNLAIISGSFDANSLILSKIPRDTVVSENSIVKLAPTILHPNRKSIVIGTIKEIIDVKEEPYLSAVVSSTLEYDSLKNIFVLLSE